MFSIINFALFVTCLILIAILSPAKSSLDFDYYGVIIAVLSVLVTVLIGWNIYSALGLEKSVAQIGLNVQMLEEKTASNFNEQKQEFEQRYYFLESKSALNIMNVFLHLRTSLMEDDKDSHYHIIYLNYCIVSYGLQEVLYQQKSKQESDEDKILDTVLKYLKKEPLIVTPNQLHELLDTYHKLNIPDKEKSKELYSLISNIKVSVQSK